MANNIAWTPSLDPTVVSYNIEAGVGVSGPWTVVTGVLNNTGSAFFNSSVGKFVYNDESQPYNTWYRIVDVDVSGVFSRPSDAFLAHPMPYFVPGSTPFRIFDLDADFQGDADKVADFVRKKLGEPIMVVYMDNQQIYAAFEEACLEYSAMVNSYQAKSVMTSFLGSPTGTLAGSENKYPTKNLQFELQMSDGYAIEAGVNGTAELYKVGIMLTGSVAEYDLQAILSGTGPLTGSNANARVRVREIFHRSPLQAYRFFGTTSGLNYLNNQFRFESFTPETMFYLLPIWEDVLRGMQFKTSNTVRRSNYSFNMRNNVLTLYPTPPEAMPLWLTYTIDSNPTSNTSNDPKYNGVSNLSNVPFGNIQYSALNSMGRNWIRRMAFAYSKEIEGQIRSKFNSIPIPNSDVSLNGPELIADGRSEQDMLRAELKELLEETTYQKLMEKEAQMTENLQNTMKNVPMGIYIGTFLALIFVGGF